MDKESLEVVEHVVSYFKEYLPNDTVLGVGRKSFHPDEHTYMWSCQRRITTAMDSVTVGMMRERY